MGTLRSRTLSGLKWSAFAQGARQVVGFSVSIVLARLLSPKEFGLLGMALVVTGLANRLTDFGFGAALVNKQDREPRHLDTVFWVNVSIGAAATLLCAAAAPLLAGFYREPLLRPVTVLLSCSFFIASLNVVQNALLSIRMDFRRLAVIDLTAVTLSGGAALALAAAGAGVWSLAVQQVLAAALTTAALWLSSSWRPRFLFSAGAFRDLRRYSMHLFGHSVFNYASGSVDSVLVGRYAGAPALGLFSRATNIVLLPPVETANILARVMFPALSSIKDDRERVRAVYLRAIRVIALATSPLILGLFAVSPHLVPFVFGAQWAGLVPVIDILSFAGLLHAITFTTGWLYKSQGRTDLMFRWEVISGLTTVLACVIGVRWGVRGVAAAYAAVAWLVLWYPGWRLAGRVVGAGFGEMAGRVLPSFLCALAMAGAVRGLDLLRPPGTGHGTALAAGTLAGAAVYLGLTWLFNRGALDDLIRIAGRARRSGADVAGSGYGALPPGKGAEPASGEEGDRLCL